MPSEINYPEADVVAKEATEVFDLERDRPDKRGLL